MNRIIKHILLSIVLPAFILTVVFFILIMTCLKDSNGKYYMLIAGSFVYFFINFIIFWAIDMIRINKKALYYWIWLALGINTLIMLSSFLGIFTYFGEYIKSVLTVIFLSTFILLWIIFGILVNLEGKMKEE